MIQNKHIIKSLPLLAAVLGRKYGVEVVIGGSNACTNGKTIYLPTLPQDYSDTLLARPTHFVARGACLIFSEVLAEAKWIIGKMILLLYGTSCPVLDFLRKFPKGYAFGS